MRQRFGPEPHSELADLADLAPDSVHFAEMGHTSSQFVKWLFEYGRKHPWTILGVVLRRRCLIDLGNRNIPQMKC
jgi:hypothetical protein